MIGQRGVPANYGGIERHVEELGARLAGRGHRVIVYCTRRPLCGQDLTGRTHRGMELRFVPSVKTKHLEAVSSSLLATLDASMADIDVVHFHALGPGLFSPLPSLFRHLPVVQTVHGHDDQRAKWGPLARTVLRAGAKTSRTIPKAVICVSEAITIDYTESASARVWPVYIPNGVTVSNAGGGTDPHGFDLEVLSRWDLLEHRYLLFVGRLVPEKDPATLIRAFSAVPTSSRLVITGGASNSSDYGARIRRLAQRDARVVLTGDVRGRALEALYSNASAFVLPSRLEGLPLTLLDACARGIPVIASDIEPNVEILREGGPGRRLFRVGVVDELSATIGKVLADPRAEREGAKSTAREVHDRFDWDAVTTATEIVYEASLSGTLRELPADIYPRSLHRDLSR